MPQNRESTFFFKTYAVAKGPGCDLKQKLSSSLTSSQADIDIAEEDPDKLSNLQT